MEKFMEIFEALEKIDCGHISKPIDFFEEKMLNQLKPFMFIVYDYFEVFWNNFKNCKNSDLLKDFLIIKKEGNLKEYLNKNGAIEVEKILKWLIHLAKAIQCISNAKLVHYNLNLE